MNKVNWCKLRQENSTQMRCTSHNAKYNEGWGDFKHAASSQFFTNLYGNQIQKENEHVEFLHSCQRLWTNHFIAQATLSQFSTLLHCWTSIISVKPRFIGMHNSNNLLVSVPKHFLTFIRRLTCTQVQLGVCVNKASIQTTVSMRCALYASKLFRFLAVGQVKWKVALLSRDYLCY